jgi:hypothetical protein
MIDNASLAGKVCLSASSSRSFSSCQSVRSIPGFVERIFFRSLMGRLVTDRLLLSSIDISLIRTQVRTNRPPLT